MTKNKERNKNDQEYDPFANYRHYYSIVLYVFIHLYYSIIYKGISEYTVTE